MLRQPDSDGRYPLSGNEYYALREIFGIISAFETSHGYLKERAQLKPGTYRDMMLVLKKSQHVLTELLRTIPAKKLGQIMAELKHTFVNVEVRPERGVMPKQTDYVYVPAKALDDLIERVMDVECFACDKRGREIKKCPLRSMIEDTFPYDIPEPDNDGCKFCGYHIDREDRRFDEKERVESV